MTLHILKDETLISQKYGPVRLTSGTDINPHELGFDEVAINSLIGRGVAKEAVLIVAPPGKIVEEALPTQPLPPVQKKASRKR